MNSVAVAAFGLFLLGKTLSTPVTIHLVSKIFKSEYFRPTALFIDRFERSPRACDRCEKAVDSGLKLVLNVRANGDVSLPTELPADLARYQATLQTVINRYRGKIGVLVIENEPDLERLNWKGTAAEYLKLLRAACKVAHRNKINCTNGGLSSQSIVALMADHYLNNNQPEKALSFIKRVSDAPVKNVEQLRETLAKKAGQLEKAKEMLYGFRAAGVDYLDFHWYEKDRSAFLEVIDFLRKAGGGLPVMSDELGQRSDEAAETIWKLDIAQRAGFPFIVWASMDTETSRSLVNSDGSLRPTGEAFRRIATK